VHLILLTTRLVEVLPTIRSRCQVVRFDAPPIEEVARQVELAGADRETAMACARLSLGDAEQARELAGEDGRVLRAAAESFARAALAGDVASVAPWKDMLAAVRARGDATQAQLDIRKKDELELYPRKEHKRIETEWTERIRRARRRVETGALDLALQVVSLWYADLACLAWGAEELVRNSDRVAELKESGDVDPARLRGAIELVEDTRLRFILNVSEELACEALAYRLERLLAL
jgi:DNA polymerase III subunit delta'